VDRYDMAGSYEETLTMSAAPHLTGGAPDGTEAIGKLQSLTRQYISTGGQVSYEDDYFNLSGLTYSTAANIGTLNTNFYRTSYAYDHRGNLERTVSPTGTIERTVYDGLNRPVSTWVGTNDGLPLQVNLSSSFTRTGIATDGSTFFGGLDNQG